MYSKMALDASLRDVNTLSQHSSFSVPIHFPFEMALMHEPRYTVLAHEVTLLPQTGSNTWTAVTFAPLNIDFFDLGQQKQVLHGTVGWMEFLSFLPLEYRPLARPKPRLPV